jgi:hypothetical protein
MLFAIAFALLWPICLTPRPADDDFVFVFFGLQQLQQYETLRFVLSVRELLAEAFKVRVVKKSVHFVHTNLLPSLPQLKKGNEPAAVGPVVSLVGINSSGFVILSAMSPSVVVLEGRTLFSFLIITRLSPWGEAY